VRSLRSIFVTRRNFVPLALILLGSLLLGSAPQAPSRSGALAPIPGTSDRAALLYAEAASAVRGKDCASAYKVLTPLMTGKGQEVSFSQLLIGFYAHACEQAGYAEERLFAAGDPDGPLEDWRLYLLADSAAARGHILLAQASLGKLLGDYPASPLRPRALLKAATLAWERNDDQRALELIGKARRDGVKGQEKTQIERLAWEIGTRQNDPVVRREAARHLLAESPMAASELQVADLFRGPAGDLDWGSLLTADQLLQRARALLDLKLDPNAGTALDAVPASARSLDWYLLKAEALTRLGKGDDALSLLAAQTASEPRKAAALEWARAMAADDVATARRGRTNLPVAERQRMRSLAQQYLQKAAQPGADPALAAKALRTLYADQVEDDLFEASIATLRQLRKIDPTDTTGANRLWDLGWREYGKRNYSGAVGYWTELFDLYPNDASARRGRYWTARAFEVLGETERAQQIYADVASADTTDFYRKNALERLRRQAATSPRGGAATEPWPTDPAVARVRLLTDLGLESLALSELELVRQDAPPRSVRALEALILARQGDRRKSVLVIREAFPALGGANQASLPEEARRLYYPLDYQETIRTWAARNRVPTHLVFGIIRQESAFDRNAQSWAGARGLMQLMPATARELAGKLGLVYSHDKLSDPEFNLQLGTTYFSHVLDMFGGNVELSLAGYNGGPYRIKRLWKEWGTSEMDRFLETLNIEESKTYVKRILVLSDSYRQLYSITG
jgi:soluble lytic murein transglycosylase-like protein